MMLKSGESRDHWIETETRASQQPAIFFHCALLSASHEQHNDISKIARRWCIPFRKNPLDE
jgi:hypothetical protein